MKITYNPQIYKYLLKSIPIGIRTSAVCFLMPNQKILKIYYSPYYKKVLSQKEDIISYFQLLSDISNDTYIGPEEVIIINNECFGYIYPYIKGKTLHSIKNVITPKDILNKYPKLEEDTKKISEHLFLLSDLHDRNIILNHIINVIDLDRGNIKQDFSVNDIYNCNLADINKTFIYSLFNTNFDQILEFYNPDINKLYRLSIGKEPFRFPEFLEELERINTSTNNKALILRKNIPHSKTQNSYYKYF